MNSTDATLLYEEAINNVQDAELLSRETKKANPKDYIVATHGPALVRAVIADPKVLDMIGIYRVNCSHLGKESDLTALANFLRNIHHAVPILIDLQGPKPRIHEMAPELGDKLPVTLGMKFKISYADASNPEHLCTTEHLKVCFPQIVDIMEIGDLAVFDDGKMTATVREIHDGYKVIECTEIDGGKESYTLKGRKGICVRNKPLGIDCITDHDRMSIEFARDTLSFNYVDNVMVSYFLSLDHIRDFVHIMRNEYRYSGELGGKFETPFAVNSIDEILNSGELTLAMFGRGDLRVEMDLRAIRNMHQIQPHFFASCKKHNVESICATGFLESMIPADGEIQPSEIGDMQISMRTGPDHLMLSAESSYGAQAHKCIETECMYQRDIVKKLASGEVSPLLPEGSLSELLYLS